MEDKRRVFVTGPGSTIGSVLIPMLAGQDGEIHVLGRSPVKCSPGLVWSPLDLVDKAAALPQSEAGTLIHLASLWLLPGWIEKFHARGVRRLIAFSSTSRFTKQSSASLYEQEVVSKLISAETDVITECERLGIAWTIFRPTLIYGGTGGDRNVADIARFILKFGIFPVFGTAKGGRQPVSAADLAQACIQALPVQASHNKAYNLSGGETFPYIEMVRRIFEVLGRRPRFIRIPMVMFRVGVKLARLHPRFRHLTSDMAQRMQTDLVFDHGDATQDFGYRPGKFVPSYLAKLR